MSEAQDMSSPGPSLSDDVAIAALVISLIALVIGLSTFLQAILATADGYRRCSKFVIGPWAQLRRRVFHWSEFRFETRYVVPSISIVIKEDVEYLGTACMLGDSSSALSAPYTKRSAWQFGLRFRRPSPGEVLHASLNMPELAEHDAFITPASTMGDLEATTSVHKQHSNLKRSTIKLPPSTKRERSRVQGSRHLTRNVLPVSWIPFLRDLHNMWLDYTPSSSDKASKLSAGSADVPQSIEIGCKQLDLACRADLVDTSLDNVALTTVAVTPFEETWDFMPADVSRPMATSKINTMVVLALRLGMQWRILDRTRLQLTADGNGFSIASTELKGLGIMFRFDSFAREHVCDKIVPSRAADKLMCGIVPGDPFLVRADFSMIGRDRRLLEMWEPGAVYNRLGLDDNSIDRIKASNRWSTHNEVAALLSSFVPVKGSDAQEFFFSGWKAKQYNVFHFFESRVAFLDAAQRLINEAPGYGTQHVFNILHKLEQAYPAEFLNGYTTRPSATVDQTQRASELLQFCSKEFNFITKWFIDKGYHKDNNSDKTWFMQLIAGHARLSANTVESASSAQPSSQEAILDKHRSLMERLGIETAYFADHLWQQTQRYIAGVNDRIYGVPQYMKARGFAPSEAEVIQAWWMLMLRGILWDISCRCRAYPGEPIPSAFYYDETTIWIA